MVLFKVIPRFGAFQAHAVGRTEYFSDSFSNEFLQTIDFSFLQNIHNIFFEHKSNASGPRKECTHFSKDGGK